MKYSVQNISSFVVSERAVNGFKRRVRELSYRIFPKSVSKTSSELRKFLSYHDAGLLSNSVTTLSDFNGIKNANKIINYIEAISKKADNTLNGYVDLLGSGKVKLDPINWHTDFKAGFEWPKGKFFRDYDQEAIHSRSDVKVPRELSRSHHILKVSMAYYLTKNEKYAKYCICQIDNWIDENPLMYSINWGCTMDVAIRAINWIWTLGLITGSQSLDNKTIEKIKCSLYQHGWYIWRNPEKEIYNSSNHYLADLAGQIHLGLLFQDLEQPGKWLEKGKEELFHEIRMQILPSGMSYERSTNYNRLVLELILIPILILKRNGHEIPSDIWYRLEKMFEFIMYSLKPDGTSPIIGDQDNGRLLPFGNEEMNDFRYLMSLGALLFNRSDFKHYGEGFNIYCLILGGEGAFYRWNKIPDLSFDLESKAFSDSGFYIMRRRGNYLLFNATGKGMYPELSSGTHTHSDLFSFELFTQGKSFLIDPGSYVYTADADQRMLFRSTKMHNTVTVDSESQNNIQKEVLWDFSRDAIPKVLLWESNINLDLVTAIHNGYTRLREPVYHERTIIFDKINEKWVIKDTLTGEGYHTYEWFFHFDVGIDFTITGNMVKTTCKDDNNIILTFEPKPGLTLRKKKSFVSKSYGNKEDGFVLVAMINAPVPIGLSIEISKLN